MITVEQFKELREGDKLVLDSEENVSFMNQGQKYAINYIPNRLDFDKTKGNISMLDRDRDEMDVSLRVVLEDFSLPTPPTPEQVAAQEEYDGLVAGIEKSLNHLRKFAKDNNIESHLLLLTTEDEIDEWNSSANSC